MTKQGELFDDYRGVLTNIF